MRLVKFGLVAGSLLVGTTDEAALADGGTVRLSRCEGRYRISVFTSPTPLRAGPVDISVLLQDAVTGEPLSDTPVIVRLTASGRTGQPIRVVASTEAATNKLLKAAIFELPEPGRWNVDVAIGEEPGSVHVQLEVDAAGRTPQWPAMWAWIGWPFPLILVFSIHQVLVGRKKRRPA